MSTIEDGGAAFPGGYDVLRATGSGSVRETIFEPGMSLRDYFAAHAVMALISSEQAYALRAKGIAESAYKIADAMLEARQAPR